MTPYLTLEALAKLKAHAIQSLGLSLDGSCAERHESVRGVPGCFAWTMEAIRYAAELGLPLQINTLVAAETADDLPAIYELLTTFAIKTTEAPSCRRLALERMHARGMIAEAIRATSVYRGFGIRDGHGIVFVSHTGDIYPAGFLPLRAGNIRKEALADVYRNAPLFRALHDPNTFKGKCGYCEYRIICGGSRARAFVHTGDPLESDPLCPYEPKTSSVRRQT